MTKRIIKSLYYAIFRRNEIEKTYVILSRMLSAYGMSSYINCAVRRILENPDAIQGIYLEHTIIDYFNGDIWLDKQALSHFKDILLGYVLPKDYDLIMKKIVIEDSKKEVLNNAIKHIRTLPSKEVFQLIKACYKIEKLLKVNTALVKKCAVCELLSRTIFVKLYNKYINHKLKIRAANKAEKIIQIIAPDTINEAA